MKKLLIFLCLAILLVGTASATTWTKKVDYNDLDVREVEFKDWWDLPLISGTQGTMKLGSHQLDEKGEIVTLETGIGWQVTMYYDFDFRELIKNGLGDVEFINGHTGKPINREWKYVYWFEEEKEREVCIKYSEILSKNGTIENECSEYGIEKYTQGEWRDYNSKDIPNNNIRIGIIVNSKQGDYIDGIWNIGSKRLDRHAYWTSGLNTNLISYFKFDDNLATTNFIDSHGTQNGTGSSNSNAMTTASGKINRAVDFTGDGAYVAITGITTGNDWSISFWLNTAITDSEEYIFRFDTGGTQTNLFRWRDADGWNIDTGTTQAIGNTNKYASTWKHWVITQAGATTKAYLDGTEIYSGSLTDRKIQGTNYLGGQGTTTRDFNGYMDEVGIWNRTITSTEITLLWSSGSPPNYGDFDVLDIDLLSPTNNTFTSNTEIDFIANVSKGTKNITNISLIIDDVVILTNSSGAEGNYTFTYNLSEGTYIWRVIGYNEDDDLSLSDANRTITIDTTNPIISASVNETILYAEGDTILLNTTVTDNINLDKVWYSYNGSNTTITGAINNTLNQTAITTTLTALEIIVYANDTAGNDATPVTLTLTLDPTPPAVNITYPITSVSYQEANTNLTINFTATDTNLDSCWYRLVTSSENLILNKVAFPTYLQRYDFETNTSSSSSGFGDIYITGILGEDYAYIKKDNTLGEFSSLSSTRPDCSIATYSSIQQLLVDDYYFCVKNNNNLTYLVKVIDGKKISLEFNYSSVEGDAVDVNCTDNYFNINTTSSSNNSVIFYANDTLGNENSITRSWTYTIFENDAIYTSSVSELSTQSFILPITISSGVIITEAKLFYNDTFYTSTVVGSGTDRNLTNSIVVRNVSDNEFFWRVVYTYSGDTSTINTSTQTQTVNEIYFGVCSATATMESLTITTKDEETYGELNHTISINIQYYPSTESGEYSKTFAYANSTQNWSSRTFCISPNYTSLYLNGIISYASSGYDTRTYTFSDYEVTNSTKTLSLYLALIDDSDVVTFLVIDSLGNTLTDALVEIEKWNIGEDEYDIVNSFTTDSKGEGASNLILYNTYYRFKVYYEGVLRLTEGPSIISSTSKTLTVPLLDESDPTLWSEITHNLSYNSGTNVTRFTWESDPEDVEVYRGCLIIKLVNNNTEVYNTCVNDYIGSIEVVVSTEGVYTAYGYIEIVDSGSIIGRVVDSLRFANGDMARYEIIGSYGQAASFLMIGTAAVIGVSAGSLTLGLGLVTLVALFINWLGYLNLKTFIFSFLSLVVLILIITARRRR